MRATWRGGGAGVIAGVTTFIVLTILGVPFAAPLAVVTFLFDLIPLVGATMAAVAVGSSPSSSDFPTDDDHLGDLGDRLPAGREQPHPAADPEQGGQRRGFFVLVSVLFGATLFGIAGALLAIPVAATVQIVLAEWLVYRRELRAEATAASTHTPV